MNKKLLFLFILIVLIILSLLSFNLLLNKDNHNNSNWSYDRNEYPLDVYRLDDLPVSHRSAYEVRQFFVDSDVNGDGVLKGDEIGMFDYKIKHSQFTFNGPYGYN